MSATDENALDWAFAVVLAPFELVAAAALEEFERIWKHGFLREECSVRPYAFCFPKEFNPNPKKLQILGVHGATLCYTLVESNVAEGIPALASNLARAHPEFTIIHVRSAPESGAEWPCQWISIYRPGEEKRLVRVMKDYNGWDFYEVGKPVEGEQPDRYSARLKKKRFTREDIVRILACYGVEIDDLREGGRPNECLVIKKWRLGTEPNSTTTTV